MKPSHVRRNLVFLQHLAHMTIFHVRLVILRLVILDFFLKYLALQNQLIAWEKLQSALQPKVPSPANSLSGTSASLPPISAPEVRKINSHRYTQELRDTRSHPSHT